MDEKDRALIGSIKELFTSQNVGLDKQIGDLKAQVLRTEKNTDDIRKQIGELIKADGNHLRNCPVPADVKEIKKTFYETIEQIEDQLGKLSFILAYKKLLQTAKFMIEWKVLFVPAFVVFCALSTIGGIKTYEAGKEFISEWVAQKHQVEVNTEAVNEIKKEEIKSILKK